MNLAAGYKTKIGFNDVKKNSRVYFYVQRNSEYVSPQSTIRYQIERLNIGGGMVLASGVFTVPTNGRYHFAFNARTFANSNYFFLRLNGVVIASSFASGAIYDDSNLHTQFIFILLLQEDLVL